MSCTGGGQSGPRENQSGEHAVCVDHALLNDKGRYGLLVGTASVPGCSRSPSFVSFSSLGPVFGGKAPSLTPVPSSGRPVPVPGTFRSPCTPLCPNLIRVIRRWPPSAIPGVLPTASFAPDNCRWCEGVYRKWLVVALRPVLARRSEHRGLRAGVERPDLQIPPRTGGDVGACARGAAEVRQRDGHPVNWPDRPGEWLSSASLRESGALNSAAVSWATSACPATVREISPGPWSERGGGCARVSRSSGRRVRGRCSVRTG